MPSTRRIAVLGLYNSGSTALAGVLHRLGVDMGAPFWFNSDDNSPRNFYEPWDLGCMLRYWWNEPAIREMTERATRVACLANWIRLREGVHQGAAGAKHPLLCLCGDDLVEAWGTQTLFVRAYRPLGESIARLRLRRWFAGHEDRLQLNLWDAAENFCTRQPHLRVEYHRLKREPAAVLGEVVAYTRLTPTAEQMATAVAFID
ncbi:MAG TPA: hypothetical protein VH575_32685 [Gemmataceae bacterium]